jgi:hypothetical protein
MRQGGLQRREKFARYDAFKAGKKEPSRLWHQRVRRARARRSRTPTRSSSSTRCASRSCTRRSASMAATRARCARSRSSRPAPARARLRALHARRDAGIVTATLGTPRDEQRIDGLTEDDHWKRFLLHYNFPPYSVGERSRCAAPAPRDRPRQPRRARAREERHPVEGSVPVHDPHRQSRSPSRTARRRWPPSAAAALSMMDAGVPIAAPVAGVAMGLIAGQALRGAHRHPR